MSFKTKAGILGVVAAMLVAFGAFGLGTTEARFQNTGNDCNPYTVQTTSGNPCVYFVGEHGIDPTVGTEPMPGCQNGDDATRIAAGSTTILGVGQQVLICVNTANNNRSNSKLTFDSNGIGRFDRAACGYQGDNSDGDARVAEWPDDACLSVSGNNTSQLVIEEDFNGLDNDLGTVIVRYTCTAPFGVTTIVITHSEGGPGTTATGAPGTTFNFEFVIQCRGPVTQIPTMTALPGTVEIIPARSNTSHSLISITLADVSGNPVFPGHEVQFTTDRCSIEAKGVSTDRDDTTNPSVHTFSAANWGAAIALILALNTAAPATYANWEFSAGALAPVDSARQTDTQASGQTGAGTEASPFVSRASAILGCNPVDAPGVTPGVANVTACVAVVGPDICRTVQVTVIGPPAAITVTAAPATVRCGERVTLTATVRDSIGQNVSDHTRVEFTTNLGGVLTGTGAVAGFAGPVVPISSTVGETFGGIATAFLLTSESHSGPYELVVTSGGTVASDPGFSWFAWTGGPLDVHASAVLNVLGGQFSTPPVNAFAQVACTIPVAAPAAPTVTAPTTGGGIVPPSTGDAGLATSGGTSLVLLALAGALAMALAGGLSFKLIRR